MIGVDLFAGAGGMGLGASLAGIDVRFAVERDGNAAATHAKNHPDCNLFVGDIRNLSSYKIKRIPKGKEETIVFGGPPCQGFSYSNTRTRRVDNQNNWLFEEFIRFVRVWQPDYVVFENVRGIVNTARGLFLQAVLDRLESLKYSLSYGLLNASDYGVPQDRARFFLIGSRNGDSIPLPCKVRAKTPTVRDAVGDLPRLSNGASESWMRYGRSQPSKYAKRLRGRRKRCPNNLVTLNAEQIIRRYEHVPQGGNWQDIPARLMKNYTDRTRCHTGIYHRLKANRPSVVIGNFRKNMLIHPFQHRGLSVREAARIQSFPDSYEFVGSIGFQQQQVGDAVPPFLAKAVFTAVVRGED